jgi:hypothetical protein
VTLSTTAAEYIAACVAAVEGMWWWKLLTDLGVAAQVIPVGVYSQSALRNIENPMSCGRTKYIDLRYHYVQEVAVTEEDWQDELNKGKRFKFLWIGTKDQLADILTKILPGTVHDY